MLGSTLLEDWKWQQIQMAQQVVKVDDVPWRLDATDLDCRLTRVGGLDISFVDTPATAAPPQRPAPARRGAGSPSADDAADAELDAGAPATSGVLPGALVGRRGSGSGGQGDSDGEAAAMRPDGLPACAAAHGPGVAALVVLSFPELRVLYEDYEPVDLSIPYLPGYLGFRECDAYARLLQRMEASPLKPQVLLVDGCGMLHPRGCGSACQVGVTCGYPSVGVAKNLLAVDGLDRFEVRRQLQAAAAAAAGAAGASPVGNDASAVGSGRRGVGGPEANFRTRQCPEEETASPPPTAQVHSSHGAGTSVVVGPPDDAADASAPAARPGNDTRDDPGANPWDTSTAINQASSSGDEAGCHGAAQQPHQCRAGGRQVTQRNARGRRGGEPAGAGAGAGTGAVGVRDVQVPLVGDSGTVHGVALCPGGSKKPLFISVGHKLCLPTAVELVRRCCLHRVPEPIRQADLRSRQWLRDHGVAAVAMGMTG